MVGGFSTSLMQGAFSTDFIPTQLKIFLWMVLGLVCWVVFVRMRKPEENFKELIFYLALGSGLAFLLTGNVLTMVIVTVLVGGMAGLGRLAARNMEYGTRGERELEDWGTGGSDIRQRLEEATRIEEGLATSDKNQEVRGLALVEAREMEVSGGELAIEGGAKVLPEATLNLLNTSLSDEQREEAHENRLAQIAEQIADLKTLPQTVQASMDLMMEFLHELVLESETLVEFEQGADADRLKVVEKMKKVLKALNAAATRSSKLEKEAQLIQNKLGKLGTKKIGKVRVEIKNKEKRLSSLEASLRIGNEKLSAEARAAAEANINEAKATLEKEIITMKQGLSSLERAEQVLNGVITQLGGYLQETYSQLNKIKSTVKDTKNVENQMENFEGKEQQLKASLVKAQARFAGTVVDLGHDKLEGHLDQVDELVVKSQSSLTGFFGALLESKKALLDFHGELKGFLKEVTELAAETHGLESLSAASQKLRDQVVGGFAQLDKLAEQLLTNNPLVELELDQLTRLSKQSEAELLQGVSVENKMFDRTMTEVSAAQSQLNAYGKVVEDELKNVEQTKQLTFSSLTRILKLVAAKTAELSAEVTQRAGKLARDMASTAQETGPAEKAA